MTLRATFVTTTYPLKKGDAIPGFVADLARHLVRHENVSVKVLAPHHPGAAFRETVDGVRIERFQYAMNADQQCLAYGAGIPDNVRNNPRAKWQVPGFFAAMLAAVWRALDETDVIHAHWVEPALMAEVANFFHRKPVVVTVHSLRPKRDVGSRLALKWADRALFNSRFTQQQAKELGYKCRGQVIYQGYDQETFGVVPRSGPARARLWIPADAPLAVAVGRMVPFKGMEVFAAAANGILANRPTAHVVIGGDGPCRSEVMRIVESSPHQVRIHVPGKMGRAEVAELLADADVFVMPSVIDARGRTETLGVAALEAMASGVATVASRVGGLVETVEDEATGLLVTPGDAKALARAVGRVLDDAALRARLANAGREAARSRFTWPVLAKQVADVYRELVRT
jgi:glycosyltransferase involved in cell wall biosynthesis